MRPQGTGIVRYQYIELDYFCCGDVNLFANDLSTKWHFVGCFFFNCSTAFTETIF